MGALGRASIGAHYKVVDKISAGEECLYMYSVPVCRLVPRLTPLVLLISVLANIVMMTLNNSTAVVSTSVCSYREL